MAAERPQWPGSLPLPTEIRYAPPAVHLVQADLATLDKVEDIVHDLFWYPDSNYYLFIPMGEGIDSTLHRQLEAAEVERRELDLYFYHHPDPRFPNDFVCIPPHEAPLEWQRTAVQGPMYQRAKLSLSSARRAQMSHEAIAIQTRDTLAAAEPAIEVKPGIYGLSLNLKVIFRRMKSWFSR